jgi:hypothetical protein
MSLSATNKICLFALCDLRYPVNLLFSQPSMVEGYATTPCTECHSPISTQDGEAIPERCNRPSCLKFDSFPLACLAVSIRHGGFKTIQYKKKLSLVVEKTESLTHLLPVDAQIGFWIPRSIADKKRFKHERTHRSRRNRTLAPPVWHGDQRPHGARRIKPKCNFPSQPFLAHLKELGYPPAAIRAAQVKAHMFWAHVNPAEPDRRANGNAFNDPLHPYVPSTPSRRTKVGGAYPKEKVVRALEERGWDSNTQAAVFEVVCYRRSAKEVAAQRGLKVTTVYQYVSRLKEDLAA